MTGIYQNTFHLVSLRTNKLLEVDGKNMIEPRRPFCHGNGRQDEYKNVHTTGNFDRKTERLLLVLFLQQNQ